MKDILGDRGGLRFIPETPPAGSLFARMRDKNVLLDLLNGYGGHHCLELLMSGRTMDGAPSTGRAGKGTVEQSLVKYISNIGESLLLDDFLLQHLPLRALRRGSELCCSKTQP